MITQLHQDYATLNEDIEYDVDRVSKLAKNRRNRIKYNNCGIIFDSRVYLKKCAKDAVTREHPNTIPSQIYCEGVITKTPRKSNKFYFTK